MKVKSYTLLLFLALAGACLAQDSPAHGASLTAASTSAAAAPKQSDPIAYSDALAADNTIDFSYDDTADWADALTDQQGVESGEFSLDDALDEAEELADQDALDAEYAVEASLDDLIAAEQDSLQEGGFAVEDELAEDLAGDEADALDFAVEDALLDEDGADADFATNEDAIEDDAAQDSAQADFAIDEDAIEDDGLDADFSSDEGALEDDAFESGSAATSADFSTADDAIAGELDAAAESVAEDLFNEAVNDAIESEFAQQDAVAASEEDGAAEESADYSQDEEAFEDAFEAELAEALLAQPTLYAKSDGVEEEFDSDAFDLDAISGYQYLASAQESDA